MVQQDIQESDRDGYPRDIQVGPEIWVTVVYDSNINKYKHINRLFYPKMFIFYDPEQDKYRTQYTNRPPSIQTVDPITGQLVVL